MQGNAFVPTPESSPQLQYTEQSSFSAETRIAGISPREWEEWLPTICLTFRQTFLNMNRTLSLPFSNGPVRLAWLFRSGGFC